MSKIIKRISFILIFGFAVFFTLSGKAKATSEVDQIASKMEVNAVTDGKYFKIGMMGNFYQVERKNARSKIHHNVYLTQISEDISSSEIENNLIPRKYIAKDNIIVGFNGEVQCGYGKTLLYGLGYERFYDDSLDTSTKNYKDSCVMSGIIKTFYTTEIVENTQMYKLTTNEYQKYDYVNLWLVADIIEADVTLRQYQKWWWGNQNLWTANITAYVMCNVREEVLYGLR